MSKKVVVAGLVAGLFIACTGDGSSGAKKESERQGGGATSSSHSGGNAASNVAEGGQGSGGSPGDGTAGVGASGGVGGTGSSETSGGADGSGSTQGLGGDAGSGSAQGFGGDSGSGGTQGLGGDAGSGGGQGSEQDTLILSFPPSSRPPIKGQLLAAASNGSVLTVAPNSYADLFAGEDDEPVLLELSTEGKVLKSRLLKGLAPPQLMSRDAEGAIYLVGSIPDEVTFDQLTIQPQENGGYVLKLSPDLDILRGTSFAVEGGLIYDSIVIDDQDRLYLGLSVYNTTFDGMNLELQAFNTETLDEQWATLCQHTASPAYVYSLDTTVEGELITAGLFSGGLSIGDFDLEKQVAAQDDDFNYNVWLAWFDSDTGIAQSALAFGGLITDVAQSFRSLKNGEYRLLSYHNGEYEFFGRSLPAVEDGSQFLLTALDADLQVKWQSSLLDQGGALWALDFGSKGESYLIGRFGALSRDDPAAGGLLLRLEADGSPGPALQIPSLDGNGIGHVAVDMEGGVWISGSATNGFDFRGETFEPEGESGQYVIRLNGF